MSLESWRNKVKQISDDAAREAEENREMRHLRAGELMALFRDEWERLDLAYKMITPYQYRIFKGAYYIDYYPTSGKYYDKQQNFWGEAEPAEIIKLFPESIE